MKIGYARVSTDEQSLALQLDALEKAECETVFRDEGISGARMTRPGLDAALAALKAGDMLIVWRLDRLGRSLRHLMNIVEDFQKRGVGLHSLTEMINTETAGGELIFHIFGAIAQFERRLISERCRAGMHAAKRRGKHVGRPHKLTKEQLGLAQRQLKEGAESVTDLSKMLGVSRVTLHRALRKAGA